MTREEVTLAYQLMLGREPESQAVVDSLCAAAQSPEALRQLFVSSPEFVKLMGSLLAQPQAVRQRHPYNLPKMPVQTEVSDDVLAQMFDRIHKQWDHLGNTEPYWSVITQPQYYQADFAAHRQAFYNSGNHNCQTFLAALRRSGVNPANLHTCLEVGCGVGRVTGYLAKAFGQVIAADISAKHLELAKTHLAEQNIHNVTLAHWPTVQHMQQTQPVDAVFSLITLQHNPPPVMAWMLRTLLGQLRSGGVAYIQLPTYRNGYLFEAERYLHSTPPNTLEMHYLPQPDVFAIVQSANCQCLEVREDDAIGSEDKMLSNTFLIQKR